MSKISNRDKILTEGLRVVHERGFANASVRDIVQAAGVPQGSFTNHFASKEAFGLEILALYLANSRRTMAETLCNESLSPLQRLRAYVEAYKNRAGRDGVWRGCLYGNFTAESCEHSEPIRLKLLDIYAEVQATIAACLRAAVAAGEVRADLDCEQVAGFILSSVQGAILLSKADRSPAPLERFEQILFSSILK